MTARDILASNLKQLRKRRGFSQEELAHEADLDRTYISALERKVYAASVDVLDQLAKALGVETVELLTPPIKESEVKR